MSKETSPCIKTVWQKQKSLTIVFFLMLFILYPIHFVLSLIVFETLLWMIGGTALWVALIYIINAKQIKAEKIVNDEELSEELLKL